VAEFEFDGRNITVIPPRELTLGDLAYIKQHFGIDSQVDLEDGLGSLDPDAWRGLLMASVRQVQPGVSPTHGGIDHVGIQALLEELNREALEWLEKKAAEDAEVEDGARPTEASPSTRGPGGVQK
jgi:hypothetical protein